MLIGVYKDIHPFNEMSPNRINAYINEAHKQEVELVFFGIHDVDFVKEKINGDFFVDNHWIKREVDFPILMINNSASRVENTVDKDKEIRIKQQIPHTVHLIEGKYKIYERLVEAKTFESHIIPSTMLSSTLNFTKMINQYRKVVLKPVDGRKGEGIYIVSKNSKNQYMLDDNRTATKLSFTKLMHSINRLVKQGNYLVQPFIDCKTKSGNPFHFRVRVMRNNQADWIMMSMSALLGAQGTNLSNANQGGKSEQAIDFLHNCFGDQANDLYTKLQSLALGLANQIDSFYPYMLDELGIDLSIDSKGNICFFEANTSPEIIVDQEVREKQRAVHMIGYAKFLADLLKQSGNRPGNHFKVVKN